MNGDLHVQRLVVELGAHFDGTCKMLKEGEFEHVSKPAAQEEVEAAK